MTQRMGSSESEQGSAWSKTASIYARVMTGVSAPAAVRLLELAGSIPDGAEVLDVGAGSGATTTVIAQKYNACKVLAMDTSAKMLHQIEALSLPNVAVQLVDVLDLTNHRPEQYTHIFSTFMLQCIKEPMKGLEGMRHCLKSEGIIALGVWGQKLDAYDIWEKACQTQDPTYMIPPVFEDPSAWRTTDELRYHLQEAGFVVEHLEDIVLPWRFPSADAFVEYWLNSGNLLVELTLRSWKGELESVKVAMRKVIQEQYGDGKDIELTGALCVARKPQWLAN